MINIELKAAYPDLEKAEKLAIKSGAKLSHHETQTDTYFKVSDGRVKLRETSSGETALIRYHRSEQSQAKRSEYSIDKIEPEMITEFKEKLFSSHVVMVVVVKERVIFLLDNVRIHLDKVESLGNFIEFEAVVENEEGLDKNYKQVENLKTVFEIADADLIEGSYSDLLMKNRKVFCGE